MQRADTHTRIVAWLKVVLPLSALAILSTLFLLANGVDPEDALPYAEVDVADLASEPRITAPSYTGMTSDGASLALVADEARPAVDGAPARAVGVRLEMITPDGGRTDVQATEMALDQPGGLVVLSGGVEIDTSTGYLMTTDALSVRLDRSYLESRSAVIATGPAGEIRADAMTIGQVDQTPGYYLLVFKGGVRLVYQPGG